MSNTLKSLLIQSDFDGTLTDYDVSFQILDEYVGPSWRDQLTDYLEGKISVNQFNASVFGRVSESREALDAFVRKTALIRPGLTELIMTCRELGYRFVIVSNGMLFYIETILRMLGLSGIEFYAAKANFLHNRIEAWYEDPNGNKLEQGFKESYTRLFLAQGYEVVYLGNGISDFAPARLCHHIFSTDSLTKKCKEEKVRHTHFESLQEIIDGIKTLR